MANTYEAYQLFAESDDEKPFATVWWHQQRIRCTDPDVLESLTDGAIDGMTHSDGKEFFDKLPSLFRSGYVYTRKVEVDAEGNKV